MSIKNIQPLYELKGHQASVLAVEYAKKFFLGEHILASGSGNNTTVYHIAEYLTHVFLFA